MNISILGGTGPEGSGLGFRWGAAGHNVIIGSRVGEKGQAAAKALIEKLPEGNFSGYDNFTAASLGDLIVLAVPYSAQVNTIDVIKPALAGKILVSVVVPLGSPPARVWKPSSGLSAAEEAQDQVGESTNVVAAFQNISAHHLFDLDHQIDCDVLICGDKKTDKDIVANLCADAGMRGVNAGGLANASVVEGFTALLIGINIRHKIKNAGIRITGI